MASPDAGDERARVLVVEDEDDLASVVTINLELAGFEVDRAQDGAAALTKVRERPPDVVLLDVMMPVLDGWQVLRALKENDRTRDIPVIMLTALAEEKNIIQGHLQGAVRYVTKPFEVRALIETVEDALREPDEQELERRRNRIRMLLQRLAELDAGREGDTGHVRLSKLEAAPRRERTPDTTDADRGKLGELTPKQRYVAAELAGGRSARDLADELGVSRSNVYATRKRIARKLGVQPDDVADEARRLGLSD